MLVIRGYPMSSIARRRAFGKPPCVFFKKISSAVRREGALLCSRRVSVPRMPSFRPNGEIADCLLPQDRLQYRYEMEQGCFYIQG